MLQSLLLGGAAAVICYAFWRHNKKLDEQAEQTGTELKKVPVGFDFDAVRQSVEKQQELIKLYSEINILQDTLIVKEQQEETVPFIFSYADTGGTKHSIHLDVKPEHLKELTAKVMNDCAASLSRLP